MVTRRAFLRSTSVVGGAALALRVRGLDDIRAASASVSQQAPADVAKDEFYWREIQQAFALDRTLINLNTGHHCSQPRVVIDAVLQNLKRLAGVAGDRELVRVAAELIRQSLAQRLQAAIDLAAVIDGRHISMSR